MKVLKSYIFNVLLGLDVFVNSIFGGSPKMTISTRVYIYRNDNVIAGWVYKMLDWLDHNHCEDAFKYDSLPANNEDSVLK